MSDRCETCRFWRPGAGAGECRRRAPAPDTEAARKYPREAFAWARWPITTADDWCGEWAAKEVPGRRSGG